MNKKQLYIINDPEIRAQVAKVGSMMGTTVARVVKDNFEVKDMAYNAVQEMRIKKPFAGYTVEILYVTCTRLLTSEISGMPTGMVELTLLSAKTKETEIRIISQSDFIKFSKEFSVSNVFETIQPRDLSGKIFASPIEAIEVAQAYNRAGTAEVEAIVKHYEKVAQVLEEVQNANTSMLVAFDEME